MSGNNASGKNVIDVCGDRLDIEFHNLCYYPSGKKGKTPQKPILKKICGKFHSGRLTAIIGPSGAGKTTLINVLSGFKTHGVTGSVKVNGRERIIHKFRKQLCYITQEFAILDLLTARETLLFAADLKLNSDIRIQKKNEMIDEILGLLGLEKVANTSVAKLSGGEKKRLSIGVELLTNPPVMFFDEPTSGLDSQSALQVITHLKSLAEGGRTVICSIHQPSSKLFQMFDDIYLIQEGQCLYNGPISDLTYVLGEAGFQCPNFYNRADFAIEVSSGERGNNTDRLIARFRDQFCDPLEQQQDGSNEETSMLHPVAPNINSTAIQISPENEDYRDTSYPQSVCKQFQVLIKRSFLCSLRDKIAVQIRIITHLLIGLLLGAVYYDVGNEASKVLSNSSCIFFFTMFLFFANGMPCVISIPLETSVVLREHLNNWYSLKAYYFSKLLADIPLQIICPTILLIPGYFLTDQPTDGTRFIQFWLICFLVSVISHYQGLAVGAFFSNPQISVFVLPAFNIPLVIFSGFFMNLRDIPKWLSWLTDISYFRYAFEGLAQCVYGYNRPNLKCSEIYCYYKSPLTFLQEFELAGAVYEYDILALVIWVVATQLSIFFTLKLRIRSLQ